MDEASLAKVADPAAGSGGIEALTEKLCAAAWALFQKSSAWAEHGARSGRLISAQTSRRARETHAGRRCRADALIGTSEFPDLDEAPVSCSMSRR